MDITFVDNHTHPSTQVHKCCKGSSSLDTILDATQVASLKDRYSLGQQLGWGQFGVIRMCTDKITGDVFACKSIAKDRLVTSEDIQSIKLEIEIMTKLSGHPNVVDLKAVYEDEDFVHLVMELCAGGELFHRLEKYGRFAESDARIIFKHLLQVVKYCHDNGIVHRDLKPENILLATKSSTSSIKLADFGLATYIKQGQSLNGTVGSPFYIAPEVLNGGYNQAADVWSAGVILYILLSGMPPFWGKTKSKIFDAVRAANLRFPPDPWENISPSARDLIMRMICVDPSKRLTAMEVLGHPWMEEGCAESAQELLMKDRTGPRQLQAGGCSFSSTFITRNEDYSFSDSSPATPAFTCKASFSSLLNDNTSPFPAAEGFSFSSCHQSSVLEISSPLPSMPSFTFFSPGCGSPRENFSLHTEPNSSNVQEEYPELKVPKLLLLSDSSLPFKHEEAEVEQKAELQKGGIAASASRVSGIHSKRRNNTISFGELDQIDIMVTESVIRWASCTKIPTVPALRLSLVF